jgi:hypothetical protein
MTTLEPHSTAAERLALARENGILYSLQRETALRDRWSREAAERSLPIVHAIKAPFVTAGSVRINLRATEWRLTEIGQALCRWIVAEHGGCVRELNEEIVDALRLPPAGAAILMASVLKRGDLLWPASEVR